MRPVVDFLVIGAMKCGTTSLHHYLECHPHVGVPPEKEVNFFFGTEPEDAGNHWRGARWYESRFPPDARLRGEVSPGYTSPDHPHVATRIARVAPEARLVYLVRDPLDRAVSQYRHHRRDGAESRPLAEALLDPDSHYVRRSRYAARLRPFLDRFPSSHIAVVDHDDLRHHTAGTVAALCRFVGADPGVQPDVFDRRLNTARSTGPRVPDDVAQRFRWLVADDVADFESIRRDVVTITPETITPEIGAVARRGGCSPDYGSASSGSGGGRPDLHA